MRRLLLILMIAFMPLRGWAGDVMAVDMVAGQLAAPARMVAEHAHTEKANAHQADCLGHVHTEPEASGDAEEPGNDQLASHCPTCNTCQVCSSAAFAVHVAVSCRMPAQYCVPFTGGAAFTSAEPAPGLKPPIS